jgi:hypothetical protein
MPSMRRRTAYYVSQKTASSLFLTVLAFAIVFAASSLRREFYHCSKVDTHRYNVDSDTANAYNRAGLTAA